MFNSLPFIPNIYTLNQPTVLQTTSVAVSVQNATQSYHDLSKTMYGRFLAFRTYDQTLI